MRLNSVLNTGRSNFTDMMNRELINIKSSNIKNFEQSNIENSKNMSLKKKSSHEY